MFEDDFDGPQLDREVWCPGEHAPLRVSGIQSGVWSGDVGSTRGQQPFRDGLVVREFQPAQWGVTPWHGRIEVRARMELSPRSMASVWMAGLEDEPGRCGEICVFEVFGHAPRAIGAGVHPCRADFDVDGRHVRTVGQAPDHPLQFMVALFDIPEREGPEDHVPLFAVDRIRWTP